MLGVPRQRTATCYAASGAKTSGQITEANWIGNMQVANAGGCVSYQPPTGVVVGNMRTWQGAARVWHGQARQNEALASTAP